MKRSYKKFVAQDNKSWRSASYGPGRRFDSNTIAMREASPRNKKCSLKQENLNAILFTLKI